VTICYPKILVYLLIQQIIVLTVYSLSEINLPLRIVRLKLLFCCALLLTACDRITSISPPVLTQAPVEIINPIARKLVAGGIAQTAITKSYDPAYIQLAYPGGDVPAITGVCTDVIIRAYRQIGIDLQQQVHEDMGRNFAKYPKIWGLKQPDKNIDHRRVANLMTFLRRRGAALPVTDRPADYQPGDLVTYDLGAQIGLHIAIVSNIRGSNGYQMIHNACCGTKVETIPRNWKINGHYRYLP
jgi:uncharacterized protein